MGGIIVNKAVLTVIATAQNKTYGDDNPALKVSYSGFIPGDTEANSISTKPTVITTAIKSSAAGIYPITAGGAASTNYTLVYQPGVMTVNKALLYVTADNQTRAYGQANPALTVHYHGFANGDSEADLIARATALTDATQASLPGSYAIVARGAQSANYRSTYTSGTLTVTALKNAGLANLTISSGSLSPLFSPATQAYYASVIVAQMKLTPVAADAAATIRINGAIVRSGEASAPLALAVGNNTINVEVTANDGITSKTYVLTVYRAAPADAIRPTNIMSPNGDGKNDAWVIKDIQLYPNNKVTVYDRAGREIYAKQGYNNDWDGTLSGAPLAQGTYYYIIELGTDTPPIKGFITILKNR